LGAFYADQQVVLLWDGPSAHWSHDMRAFIDSQRDWLQVERLPGYAPELNPVEGLWANLKGVELANFAGDTVVEVADAAEQGIHRVRDDQQLVWSFLDHTGLTSTTSTYPTYEKLNNGSLLIRAGGRGRAAVRC
jgi:hypothetical protein